MITTRKNKHEYVTTIYITSDGQEFGIRSDAEQHEEELRIMQDKHEIPHKRIGLSIFEYNVDAYKIKSEDDLKYLNIKEWNRNGSYNYEGPGWYIAEFYNGGDYPDYYHVEKIDHYIENLEEDLTLLKDLTNS